MPPLHDTLATIADRQDAAGAMVISDEGLVIDAVLAIPVEAETVAALAATALRSLRALTEALAQGGPRQVVVESTAGTVVVAPLSPTASLVVIAAPDGELGELLYVLRCHAPALAGLV